MNQINFQTRIPEELREQFRQAREQAGAYSDAETLKILVSNFFETQESPELDDQATEIGPQKRDTTEESENLDELAPEATPDQENDNNIVIRLTPAQRAIISKCYDDADNLGEEVLKTLVQIAARYVKTREGFGLFDKHERYFITKGIEYDQFQTAFDTFIKSIEAENDYEL